MHDPGQYPPLQTTNQPAVGTAQAAFYLGRQQQTLRRWACTGAGAITPRNINGRLAWPVANLREVLGIAQ